MMRHRVVPLLIVTSGLFSVLLAVAVNVATGGVLPGGLQPWAWLAWPLVGLLAMVGVGLALWQQRLSAAASPEAAPPPVALPAELPAAPVVLGRDGELAALESAVGGGAQLLVIAASAGTGKSALGLRFAQVMRDSYPGGQLYAALQGASADPVLPEDVLVRFLRALGRPDDELRGDVVELSARFRSVVADRRVLVLLDDARDAAQVRHLLPGGEHSLAVVTSRRLLSDLLGASVFTLGGLDPGSALELLAVTAGGGRVAADPDGARRVVQLCGGLPLAVRIAGGRLKARAQWTPTALADRLVDEERRLDELRLADRAVRSSFQAVYDELAPGEQVVFRLAGSYPGASVGLGAAAARCDLDEQAVADALERLTDAFLVESPAPDRYRLHDLLRLFAQELAGGEAAECLERHLRWLSTRARPGVWLAEEREDIVAVLHAAVAAGLEAPARRLIGAVHPLVTGGTEHAYRLRLWQAGVAAAGEDEAFRVRALRWVSHSYGMAGQVALELQTAEQALDGAERLGSDVREIALAAWRVGDALRAQDRFTESEAALLRALDLLAGLGAVDDEIEVRLALGTLYNTFWKPELSGPLLARALELLPDGPQPVRGWAVLGLGLAHKLGGDQAKARDLYAEAFVIAQRSGDDFLLGYCLQERGWLAAQQRAFDAARADFTEMLAIFERMRSGTGVGGAHAALGEIADMQGQWEAALAHYDAGAAEFERLGMWVRLGEVLLHRSTVLKMLGRELEAEAARERGEALVGDAPLHRGPGLVRRLNEPTEEQ
ncbi:ATP-binding protein [Actinoplanes friuliensis]|uniref:ATP-binding protein n=1 Tax=Actinoplanes friuliensis TaxID=196914 RepID=UPI0006948EBB|nr:NB-ARC domain-containing protein [Actinoplanes friuliensis]